MTEKKTKKTENMKYWNAMRHVPESAKKPIEAGRMRGLTSINPTWQKEKMTEAFGPIGVGWKCRFVREPDTVFNATGEVLVNMSAFVKVRIDEEWTDEIQGFGGCKIFSKERNGLYFDDEAVKKAATNALGNALQYWGVGADVRYENMEDDKYTAPEVMGYAQQTPPPQQVAINTPIPPVLDANDIIRPEQVSHIEGLIKSYGKNEKSMLSYINGIRVKSGNSVANSVSELTYADYCLLVEAFNGGK